MSEKPCTCHPDDNPPKPCAERFAYSECVRFHEAELRGWKAAIEAAARLVEGNCEVVSNVAGRYLAARYDGDVGGMVFASAIRSLTPPEDVL